MRQEERRMRMIKAFERHNLSSPHEAFTSNPSGIVKAERVFVESLSPSQPHKLSK
jgi:hypothetical protein